MKSALTDAVGGDIPEADVYVALTFDDGPTGATDTYPNGYTATLLEELKSAMSMRHSSCVATASRTSTAIWSSTLRMGMSWATTP